MSGTVSHAIDVFHGRVSQQAARIYARTLALPGGGDWTLRGTVRGPYSEFGHTLPATYPLRDRGAGPSLLAEATVPDPCFWSAQLPAVYEVHVELCSRGGVLQTLDQSLGIRCLAASGDQLRKEGKRWVLRGVHASAVLETDLADWREVSAALVAEDPTDQLCAAASRRGVLLVARLAGAEDLPAQIRRLARWAAVAMVVLPGGPLPQQELKNVAPNLLLADWLGADNALPPADAAQLVFCEIGNSAQFRAAIHGWRLPIVAVRRLNEVRPLTSARAACDLLQAELAQIGDFAGYVV